MFPEITKRLFDSQCIAVKSSFLLLGLSALFLSILGYYLLIAWENQTTRELEEKLSLPSILLSQQKLTPAQAADGGLIGMIVQSEVLEVFIVDPNGMINSSSDPEKKGKSYRNFLHPPELTLPFQASKNFEFVHYQDGNDFVASSLAPVNQGPSFLGNLFLRISTNAIKAEKRKLIHFYTAGCILTILLLSLIQAFFIYRHIVPRIRYATSALETIDYRYDVIPKKIPTGPPDQIGVFINRLNTILHAVAEYNYDLRKLNIAGEQLASVDNRELLYNTATNIICHFFSVQQGEVDQLIDEEFSNFYDNFHELGRLTPSEDRSRLYLSLPSPDNVNENVWVIFFREDDNAIPKAGNPLYIDQISRIVKSATRRIRAFEEIASAEERYRELFSSAVEGIFRITASGRFEVINPALAAMSGYESPEEMLMTVRDIENQYFVNPKDRMKIFEHLMKDGKVVDQETFFKKKNGSAFPASISCHCVHNQQGGIIAYEGRIVNIEERKLREREEQNRKAAEAVSRVQLKMLAKLEKNEQILQQSLKEKEILLREIYHRTKNNMLVIISMLKLQLNKVEDLATLEIFKETENRIRAMSMVHEKLYQSESLVSIDLGSYLEDLVITLVQSMVVDDRIRVETAFDSIPISIDHAVPLGLAVNEIVTNSLKHGFPGNAWGKILITLTHASGDMIRLKIQDTGIGLPERFTIEHSSSFGMQITRNLITKQLNGTITMDNEIGTQTTICFTEPDRKQRIPAL